MSDPRAPALPPGPLLCALRAHLRAAGEVVVAEAAHAAAADRLAAARQRAARAAEAFDRELELAGDLVAQLLAEGRL